MVVSKRSRDGARFLAVRSLAYPYRSTIDMSTIAVRPETIEKDHTDWTFISAVVRRGTRTYAFTQRAHRDAFAAKYNGRMIY